MTDVRKIRFRFIAVMLCTLIMVSIFVPILGAVRFNQADAAGEEITFYFDTSCVGTGSGTSWKKDMTNVYFYAFKSSSNTGIQPMTDIGKAGTDGGKLFSATINKSKYSYIILLAKDHWSSSLNKTQDYQLSNVSDKSILMLNTNGFNVNSQTVQGLYVSGKYKEEVLTDYSGRTFSILNLDDENTTLKLVYTDETKDLESSDPDPWKHDGTSSSSEITVNVTGRHYLYNNISVPPAGSSGRPWQTVEIYTSGDQLIKKYYFPEGKILDRSFFYGVTDFQSTAPMSYGDGTKLCYQTGNLTALGSMDYEIYFDKEFFTTSPDVGTEPAAEVTKDGNAKYKSASDVSLTGVTLAAGDNDLSGSIFSVYYNGVQYNIFAPKTVGDNLVTVNDNVAVISGKYTVQSTNNKMPNGQEYITVQADMYDYQYDHNSPTVPNYTYNYSKYGKRIVFTDNYNWGGENGGKIGIYFTGGNDTSGDWPGKLMKFIGNNNLGQGQYEYYIPFNTTKIIFNNNNGGNQTVDINNPTESGYYISGGSGTNHTVGTFNIETTNNNSQLANAKRPYLAINEAISKSTYGATDYPMYLGQFWLPNDSNMGFGTSDVMYTNDTAARQRAAHNNDTDTYLVYKDTSDPDDHNQTSGYYTNFGFGKILNNFKWAANLAYRTSAQDSGSYRPYDAVAQGLVYDTLNSEGKLMDRSGTCSIPFFDESWWTQDGRDSFTTSQNKTVNLGEYIKSYKGLDFPFFKIGSDDITFSNGYSKDKLLSDDTDNYEGDYYVFDSKHYSVRVNNDSSLSKYNGDTNRIYDNYGTKGSGKDDDTGREYGFFPFNDPADGGANSTKLHYGFGVKYTIDFYLTEKGTLDDTADGIPITFTFQGDDDVWVFLDDKLILDMGGAHKNALGEINFRTRNTWISAVGNVTDSTIVTDGKADNKESFASIDPKYLKKGKHKITMYYLERGMLNSNLYVMFNLPLSLTKWDLQTDTDFSGVNEGFKSATKYVSDNDVFNFSVQNKGTTEVVGSDFIAPATSAESRVNTDADNRTTSLSPGSGSAHTYNFIGSDGSYQPLKSSGGGVTYELSEPGFAGGSKICCDTRTVGGTEGVVSLQYGELAEFSKQLNFGTSMIVKQLETLSAPAGGSRAAAYKDDTGRTSSKYYITHYKQDEIAPAGKYRYYAGIYRGDDVSQTALSHVDTMYDQSGLKNYSTNHVINPQVEDGALHYEFSDPTNAADRYVYLRQVVVNEVKTVSLRIGKELLANEVSGQNFKFKITFSNVFGSDDADNKISYNNIVYKLYGSSAVSSGKLDNDGKFDMEAGQYVVIEGIPVGTKFYVQELLTTEQTETYELNDTFSINLGSAASPMELTDDTVSLVTNARKTGNLQMQKLVLSDTGSVCSGLTDEFTIELTMTPQTGVNLTEYPIKFIQNGSDIGSAGKVTETISGDSVIYSVKLIPNSSADNNTLRLTVENIPYGTAYSASELTVPDGYIKPDSKPTGSYWTDSNYNSNHTSTAYTNVFYKNSAHSVNSTPDVITVENVKVPIIMPTTGGSGVIFIVPFGILAIVLSGAALMIYKKKTENGYNKGKGRYMK